MGAMATPPVSRRYMREFSAAMAIYAVVMMLSFYALKSIEATWLRALVALLPALPIGLAARALLRFVRDCDELQRRIQLEAFSLASLVLTMSSFALGLLVLADVVRLDAGLALSLVMPAFSLLYGVFCAVTTYRYQ